MIETRLQWLLWPPPRRTLRVGAASAGVASTMVALQIAWVAHRPLPTLREVDASGVEQGSGDAGAPLRVIAVGDSTLTGPGLDSGEQVWLRRALADLHHHGPIELTSWAAGGSRVRHVTELVDDVIRQQPDLVVVAVGANDVLHGTSLRSFRSRFQGLVEGLLAGVSVVAVTNIGDLGNIARIPYSLTPLSRARARTFCAVVETIVNGYERAVLLDVTSADTVFRDRAVFAADLFHPTRVGHAAWADAVLPGLRTAIDLAEVGRGHLDAGAGAETQENQMSTHRGRGAAACEPAFSTG